MNEIGPSRGERIWQSVIAAVMAIPGAHVDRDIFLREQLENYVETDMIDDAINRRPALAGIPQELIDSLADANINSHLMKVSAASFAAGLPGGWFVAATMPADVAQYFWHYVVIAQKLAYLYGWPDIEDHTKVDAATENILTILAAAGLGSQAAGEGLRNMANGFAGQTATRLPRQPLTQFMAYNELKRVAKWLGIKVTKDSLGKSVAKVVPVVGGAASGGITYLTFRTSAKKMRRHFGSLRLALPPDGFPLSRE